jgi:ornithine cyclodeaminase/alanine dehydrogenase-like protein (mu-crystallin family)
MLVLSQRDVESLLDVDALIDCMASAMADFSTGQASVPDRVMTFVAPPTTGLLDMPAYVPTTRALMTKLTTVFPANADGPLPVRQAVIVAFDPDDGSPMAMIAATALTAVRTGACSALAVRLLARDDASTLAILGTGAQARAHLLAVPRVRQFHEIRVASHDPARARAFAEEMTGELGIEIAAASSFEEALAGADVVCAATYAVDPAVRLAWLSSGVHVCSVGFNPRGREVDDELVCAAAVFVDSRAALLGAQPANRDLIEPIERGVIDRSHIRAELGDIVAGTASGRTDADMITLYKSGGVAVQEAAAVALLLTAAHVRGAGQRVDL